MPSNVSLSPGLATRHPIHVVVDSYNVAVAVTCGIRWDPCNDDKSLFRLVAATFYDADLK